LTQQEVKKNKNKKSRVKKDDDDEEMKFQINSCQSSFVTDDFISFEDDEHENENAKYTKFNIEDKFLSEKFYDIYDK
jgi:hypothetical protein